MKRDASTLAKIGEALWGPNWQTPMAYALEVADRTVRRWVKDGDVPDGIWADLAAVCKERGDALLDWSKKLAS